MGEHDGPAIDQDNSATWRQLRDRLREIRVWADDLAGEDWNAMQVLKILNRPRETEASSG
jgi:hypothetical protein